MPTGDLPQEETQDFISVSPALMASARAARKRTQDGLPKTGTSDADYLSPSTPPEMVMATPE
jgi:hypothetical protein